MYMLPYSQSMQCLAEVLQAHNIHVGQHLNRLDTTEVGSLTLNNRGGHKYSTVGGSHVFVALFEQLVETVERLLRLGDVTTGQSGALSQQLVERRSRMLRRVRQQPAVRVSCVVTEYGSTHCLKEEQ